MVRVARSPEGSGRSLVWVARPGVVLLDLEEHLRYERESLRRFPRSTSGAISWDAVSDDVILFSSESENVDSKGLLQQWSPQDQSLIFFWANLAIPSVKLTPEMAQSHLPDILETISEFWVYSIGGNVIFEESFDGIFTISQIPEEGAA
jgi:hypothetical protein